MTNYVISRAASPLRPNYSEMNLVSALLAVLNVLAPRAAHNPPTPSLSPSQGGLKTELSLATPSYFRSLIHFLHT